MSETAKYLLAQPYTLTAQTIVADDDVGSPRNVSVAAGVYRAILADGAGTGTAATPYETLSRIRADLGIATWDLSLLASGLVRVTYLGTGTGTLTLPNVIRDILGLASTTVGPLATNASVDGVTLPTHCVFALAAQDAGWQTVPGRVAVQSMPDGTAYGWQDGRATRTREVTLTMLPRDAAARSALSMCGTPALAESTYALDAALDEPAQYAWSVAQCLATAAGLECGWTDDLQGVIAGTVTSFDAVYLTGESFAARTVLSIEGYDQRRSVGPLTLSWTGSGTPA